MTYKHVTLLFVGVIACTIANLCSCDQPAENSSRPPAIYGRVVDSTGKPVANAGVGLIFNYAAAAADSLESGMLIGPNPASDMGELRIKVAALKSGQITIQFLRADTREVVKTVVDTYRNAGMYEFLSSLLYIPNQAYIIRYINESDTVERLMILNHHFFSNIAPYVTTNNDGRFTIPYSSLSIGRSFLISYDDGGTTGEWGMIGDSLQLTISAPDLPIVRGRWNLKVDANVVVDSTLRLL
jgi:hypothetical protein